MISPVDRDGLLGLAAFAVGPARVDQIARLEVLAGRPRSRRWRTRHPRPPTSARSPARRPAARRPARRTAALGLGGQKVPEAHRGQLALAVDHAHLVQRDDRLAGRVRALVGLDQLLELARGQRQVPRLRRGARLVEAARGELLLPPAAASPRTRRSARPAPPPRRSPRAGGSGRGTTASPAAPSRLVRSRVVGCTVVAMSTLTERCVRPPLPRECPRRDSNTRPTV